MSELHSQPEQVVPAHSGHHSTANKVVPSETNPWTEKVEVNTLPTWQRWLWKAATWGQVEIRGISPIPVEERTVKRTINIFTLWLGMSTNILAITFGMLGPEYGLSLRDSSLIILFFTLLTTTLPAYLSTLGPKTGMRQMIQARYSWGRYLISIPVFLNLATMIGFAAIISVVGGQCLSAVADGRITPTIGIIIIAIVALVISFCGFKVLHYYERYAVIPAIIAVIIAVGCGGKGLSRQAVPEGPATAEAILSFAMIVSSYMIPWACLASDFTTYLEPTTSSWRIAAYTYAGLSIPTILLMILGAAIGGAVAGNPDWEAGYEATLTGGVLDAMLRPAHGFGKFLLVILSLSLLGNVTATSYSITLNFQMLLPQLSHVPRYLWAIAMTAIVIPVSIRASVDFYDNLSNVMSLIGYWSSAFLAVLVVEHVWFRGRDAATYDPAIWNDGRRLPWGVAALAASALSFALVIPSMAQVWYTGPIAKKTGDIGFELAFVVTALLYLPLRTLEKKFVGR